MARRRRVIAALAVAAMCAPGTWLRTDLPRQPPSQIAVAQVAGPRALPAAMAPGDDWALAGIWHYQADSLLFGGFSALLALEGDRLRAFSDRGYRFTVMLPDRAASGQPGPATSVAVQQVKQGWAMDLWDIEASTRDPATGTYWLGFENHHAIHRFTKDDKPAGLRGLSEAVDWNDNSGIEAMVRLSDGRFVVMPEGQRRGLLFADDPVAGGAAQTFRIALPDKGFAITAAKQLPDGRLLVLLRKLVRPGPDAWPPFASALAIGDVPRAGGVFAPAITLRLDDVLPRENYEGLALRPCTDGRLEVWIIADDNVSLFQRTLLAKLIYSPARRQPAERAR